MIRTAALVLLLSASSSAQDAVDLKSLQGHWRGASFTEGTGKDPAQGQKMELVFKDDRLIARKGNGTVIGEATIVVAADGKSVDATGTSGGYRNKSYAGILKIEGDTLTWCSAGTAGKDVKRPGGYTADAPNGHYLMVVKKLK